MIINHSKDDHLIKSPNRTLKRTLTGLAFVAPSLIGFLILTVYPVFYGIYLSFTSWDLFNAPKFIGLANYMRLLTDDDVRVAILNTLYLVIGTVPGVIVFSLFLALLLNQKLRLTNFYRTTYFFPYISSMVSVALLWSILLHPFNGPVNHFLRFIGVTNPPGWLVDPNWAMFAVILVFIWKNCGYYMVLFLAGLQNIPSEIYEAAEIDGANVWQKFRMVTLPLLAPTMTLVLILVTIQSFKTFDSIYLMTQGGPGRATMVMMMRIFFVAFQNFELGRSCAISFLLFGFIAVISLVQWKIQNHSMRNI